MRNLMDQIAIAQRDFVAQAVVILLTAMKAAGVWPETISRLWTRTNPKSGPASSTQTGICRRRGTGPETSVRKCTFGNPEVR